MARSIYMGNLTTAAPAGVVLPWDGGEGGFYADGNWDGATVTLQAAPVSPLTGLDLDPVNTDVVATSAEPYVSFNHIPSGSVKAVMSGAGPASNLFVVLARK
jgi:hypothetical protein